MFNNTKPEHFAHIFGVALISQVVTNELLPLDPDKIINCGHLIIQALVAIVTIWATIRKALQESKTVVKTPAPGPAEAKPAEAESGALEAGRDNTKH